MQREITEAVQNYFVRLLRDYVHQRPSAEPEEEMNWKLLVQYTKEQDLSGIIYCQSKDLKSANTFALHILKKGFFSDIYRAANNEYNLSKVQKEFDREKVPYMLFKGSVLRKYYPIPDIRTMGDVDILIHHANRKETDMVMKSLGYQRMIDNHAVWTYFKPLQMFELHDIMFYEELSNNVDYGDYFSSVWETADKVCSRSTESYCYIPDINRHFLYTMAHTAKHVINNGMGFRAFLDMVFFCRNAEAIEGKAPNWEWITEELKKLQLYEFTCICFSLCEYWFDVSMPFRKDKLDPSFADGITRKMFRDGIFGLRNDENAASRSAKEIKRAKTPYYVTALKLTVKRLFPPYEDMQLIPWYAWVDGKPWLTPAAWVYRWFSCLTHKRKTARNLLFEPYQKKDQIEEREDYLGKWGL